MSVVVFKFNNCYNLQLTASALKWTVTGIAHVVIFPVILCLTASLM